ncbi:hypothetical protein C7R54_21775 [Achromobacter aloeverae]|uniref:Uncharacterized protein n=1 Tax=Achromobacter aloeverae TaxID=1750518 RepID=A0A4Q1HER4_9BURK|nr:hypothetical protein C7R54_21775 [Achromobacter aloeverae]
MPCGRAGTPAWAPTEAPTEAPTGAPAGAPGGAPTGVPVALVAAAPAMAGTIATSKADAAAVAADRKPPRRGRLAPRARARVAVIMDMQSLLRVYSERAAYNLTKELQRPGHSGSGPPRSAGAAP